MRKVRSYVIFFEGCDRAWSVYRDGNDNKLKFTCVTICRRTFVSNNKFETKVSNLLFEKKKYKGLHIIIWSPLYFRMSFQIIHTHIFYANRSWNALLIRSRFEVVRFYFRYKIRWTAACKRFVIALFYDQLYWWTSGIRDRENSKQL